MPAIEPLVRDEHGYGIHPHIASYILKDELNDEEYVDLRLVPEFNGYSVVRVEFESDSTEELEQKYMDGDFTVLDWTPTAPSKDSVLVAVSESDDGPHAFFVVMEPSQ